MGQNALNRRRRFRSPSISFNRDGTRIFVSADRSQSSGTRPSTVVPLCPVRAHRTTPPIDSMESTIAKWIEIEEGVDAH